jgi:hypothetical protein
VNELTKLPYEIQFSYFYKRFQSSYLKASYINRERKENAFGRNGLFGSFLTVYHSVIYKMQPEGEEVRISPLL